MTISKAAGAFCAVMMLVLAAAAFPGGASAQSTNTLNEINRTHMAEYAALPARAILAAGDVSSYGDMLTEQNEASGADRLEDELPESAAEAMERAGLGLDKLQSGEGADIGAVLEVLAEMAAESSKAPLTACAVILAATIICALAEGLSTASGSPSMAGAAGIAATVAAAGAVIAPLAVHVESSADVIGAGCGFASVCIPVISAIMLVSGRSFVSAGCCGAMLAASEVLSLATGTVLLPLLRILLAVAAVSSVSPSMKLSGVLSFLERGVKWLLGLLAVVFTGFLGVSAVAASAVDGAASRTLKFVVTGSVPVIGGAMSEAISSVRSCIGILRSSVGAFGVAALMFTFLPTVISTLLWMLGLGVCTAVAETLDVKAVHGLLKSASSVMSMLLSSAIFTAVLLISATAVLLLAGGA